MICSYPESDDNVHGEDCVMCADCRTGGKKCEKCALLYCMEQECKYYH